MKNFLFSKTGSIMLVTLIVIFSILLIILSFVSHAKTVPLTNKEAPIHFQYSVIVRDTNDHLINNLGDNFSLLNSDGIEMIDAERFDKINDTYGTNQQISSNEILNVASLQYQKDQPLCRVQLITMSEKIINVQIDSSCIQPKKSR